MHLFDFDLQMKWIQDLQHALRSPLVDWFFIGWNYFDTLPFVMVVIVSVWTLIDRKIGIKMFYIFVLSGVLNKFLKGVFGMPRPCQVDPSVAVWLCYPNFGFPSGAGQSAMLYIGLLLIECKRKIYWLWGILFALVLCFSRIYLGLHFFIDILGGLAVGAVLTLIYWKVFPLLEKHWKWAIFVFPFLLLPMIHKSTLIFFWISLSAAAGLLLSDKKEKMPRMRVRVMQAVSVIAGVSLCLIGMTIFPKFSAFFGLLLGFWLSYTPRRLKL